MKQMAQLIQSSEGPSLDDVLRNSGYLNTNRRPLAALILRFLWCDLYDCSEQTPEGAVESIANNVGDIATMTVPFVKAGGRLRGIAIEFSLKRMEGMLEELRKQRGLDVNRALSEGKCVLNVVQVYHAAKLYSKVTSVGIEGVQMLALALGAQVVTYSVYGRLLNYVGMAFACVRDPSKAGHHFSQARDACRAATDFESSQQQMEQLNRAIVGVTIANESLSSSRKINNY